MLRAYHPAARRFAYDKLAISACSRYGHTTLRPQQILSPRPLMVRNVSRFASGVNGSSGIMSAYAGAQRTEDAIGAAKERSSLQWARWKIEEVKAGIRDDP